MSLRAYLALILLTASVTLERMAYFISWRRGAALLVVLVSSLPWFMARFAVPLIGTALQQPLLVILGVLSVAQEASRRPSMAGSCTGCISTRRRPEGSV